MTDSFWVRVGFLISDYPWKSVALAILVAGCGAAFLALGQL